jgi:3'-5' exoribonuclease
VQPRTVADLKANAGESDLPAILDAQLQSRVSKTTRSGKPYLELCFADATGSLVLKAWSDSKLFEQAADLPDGTMLRLEAGWSQNEYGIDAKRLKFRPLTSDEQQAFLAGDPGTRERQNEAWKKITAVCESLGDPRLHAFCRSFLDEFGDRFRRAAAARRNHHARRGGLIEHTAQMMCSAEAICAVYPELNRDLLLAGVLVHDCGKMWENGYPEDGFSQAVNLHGEMLGHIPLGIELVNKLWRELADSPAATGWLELEPASEDVRLHLLHLVGSHHGQYDFGSPVLPRTPEAYALHYIDNLDAKLEMVKDAYANVGELADGIYDRRFPLSAGLVRPLPVFEKSPGAKAAEQPQAPPAPPAEPGELFS